MAFRPAPLDHAALRPPLGHLAPLGGPGGGGASPPAGSGHLAPLHVTQLHDRHSIHKPLPPIGAGLGSSDDALAGATPHRPPLSVSPDTGGGAGAESPVVAGSLALSRRRQNKASPSHLALPDSGDAVTPDSASASSTAAAARRANLLDVLDPDADGSPTQLLDALAAGADPSIPEALRRDGATPVETLGPRALAPRTDDF